MIIEFLRKTWRPMSGWCIAILIPVLFGLVPVIQVLKTGEVHDFIYTSFVALAGVFGGGLVASRSYEKKNEIK